MVLSGKRANQKKGISKKIGVTKSQKYGNNNDEGYVLGYCTVPDIETGKKIAHYLVGRKFAACVNIVPSLTSIYRWEGEIYEEHELLLIIKTKRRNMDEVITQIKSLHPYKVPEIIFTDIIKGYKPYLDWVAENSDFQ